MQAIPMILMAVGTTVSAIGTIQQGREAQRQAEFQAQQAQLQSQEEQIASNVAYTNAAQTNADVQAQWDDTLRQRDRVLGQQRAAAAKSGLQYSGSIRDVGVDTALEFQREANRFLFSGLNQAGNYRAEAFGHQRSSKNLLTTADNYRKSGAAAKRNSYWSAAGTLIQGAGMAAYMRPKVG